MQSVLESAKYIASRAKNVFINDQAVVHTAKKLLSQFENGVPVGTSIVQRDPLEPPGLANDEIVEWTFLIDTLNFCFWSDEPTLFTVSHLGVKWTGYRSLCAALARAKSNGMPVHKPSFYGSVTIDQLRQIFTSDTHVQLPMMEMRLKNLHEAAAVLNQKFGGSVTQLVLQSNKSARKLVELLITNFPSFCDAAVYEGREVVFLKRAQIFIAGLWHRFGGEGYGEFHDIDSLTMFADYRVPQTLLYLKVLSYDTSLMKKLQSGDHLAQGSPEEVEIRGCSVWAVELIRRKMSELQTSGENGQAINSVMLDFYLWNYAKVNQEDMTHLPIHRTETIFY